MKKFLLIYIILFSCGDELIKIPALETNVVLSVGVFNANPDYITGSVSGNITDFNDNLIIAYGHCWDTVAMPTIEDDSTNLGVPTGTVPIDFSSNLEGYELGVTYYVRVYAINDHNEVFYSSNEIEFKISDVWIEISDTVTARDGAVAFAIQNKGYLIGGNAKFQNSDNYSYVFDPRFDSWQKEPYFCSELIKNATTFKIGQTDYIGGGQRFGSTPAPFKKVSLLSTSPCGIEILGKKPFRNIEEFSGGDVREFPVGFSIQDSEGQYKGYMGTGDNNTGTGNNYSDFWEYDPQDDSWTEKASFPGGLRTRAVAFVIDNRGFLGLGCDCQHTTRESFDDLWEYIPTNDEWKKRKELPGMARSKAVSFTIRNFAYVGLGENQNVEPLNDFWRYDPQNDSWIQIADFPGAPRAGAVAFAINNVAYVGTGRGYGDFWKYIPD